MKGPLLRLVSPSPAHAASGNWTGIYESCSSTVSGLRAGSTNGRTLHSSPVVFLDFRRGLLWNAASFLCSIRETSRFGVSL